VFGGLSFEIIIPSTILFVAYDAASYSGQISIGGVDSCAEYERWQQLRRTGMSIDFRRICTFCSGLPSRSDCLLDLSGLSKGSLLNESDGISTRTYHRGDDEIWIHVKSMGFSMWVDEGHLERIIAKLMTFRHPCIAGVIGVDLQLPSRELKIVEMSRRGSSLLQVVSSSPEWWTPTAKAKAVVGLVLGLRFAHSFGQVHGHLTENDIDLDENGMIEIKDFCMNDLYEFESDKGGMVDLGGFSRESWKPNADIQAFSRILSAIVFETFACQDGRDRDIPLFVSKIIAQGQPGNLRGMESLTDIFEILKQKDFKILAGVDVEEVSNFASWIESSERLTE
jgi:hypothetical protein